MEGEEWLPLHHLLYFLTSSTYISNIKHLLLLPLFLVLIHKFSLRFILHLLFLHSPGRVGEVRKQLSGVWLPVGVNTQQENISLFQEMGAKIQPCFHPHWLQIGVFADRL